MQTHRAKTDLGSRDSRRKLARLIMVLFGHWELSARDQTSLLGFNSTSICRLSRYRGGKPLPARRDVLDRVGYLLSIHSSLRQLYPENLKQCYRWLSQRNRFFDGQTPIEVMTQGGMIGLARVAAYLHHCTLM